MPAENNSARCCSSYCHHQRATECWREYGPDAIVMAKECNVQRTSHACNFKRNVARTHTPCARTLRRAMVFLVSAQATCQPGSAPSSFSVSTSGTFTAYLREVLSMIIMRLSSRIAANLPGGDLNSCVESGDGANFSLRLQLTHGHATGRMDTCACASVFRYR